MSAENGGGPGPAAQGAPETRQPRRERGSHRKGRTPDSSTNPEAGKKPETGGKHRAEAQSPAASEAHGFAAKIKGLLGMDRDNKQDPNVNPQAVLEQVSKGALLPGGNVESTRQTAIRGREVLTRPAKEWARSHAHKADIRATYDELAQKYRDSHNGADPVGAEAKALYGQSVHISRENAGYRVLSQIQEIQGSDSFQQGVRDRQAAIVNEGGDVTGRKVREIRTEAIVDQIKNPQSQEQPEAVVSATAEDPTAQQKREAMLNDDNFKEIRAGVKDAVFKELGISSLAEAQAKGLDPADVLKTIHTRSETAYAEAPAPIDAADAEDQALTDRAKAEKQELIDDETIRLFGEGMTYEEALEQAFDVAKAAIDAEDAEKRKVTDQAERDAKLRELKEEVGADADAMKILVHMPNFDNAFAEELGRYENNPTARETSDAYDRAVGRMRQEQKNDDASIRQEAADKGEIVKATIRLTKEAQDKGLPIPDNIDELALEAAMDVIKTNRLAAEQAKVRTRKGKSSDGSPAPASLPDVVITLDGDPGIAAKQKEATAQVLASLKAQLATAKPAERPGLEAAIANLEPAVNGTQVSVDAAAAALDPTASVEVATTETAAQRKLLEGLGVMKPEDITHLVDTLSANIDPSIKAALMTDLLTISQKKSTGLFSEDMILDEVQKTHAKYAEAINEAVTKDPDGQQERTRWLKLVGQFLIELAKSLPGALVESTYDQLPVGAPK